MTVNFFQKLSQTVHNQFQKTFEGENFPKRLEDALEISRKLYEGLQPGYNACNCCYHNDQHVTEVTECLAQLIGQYAHSTPHNGVRLTSNAFEHIIVAALFHDAGYICKKDQSKQQLSLDHETRSAQMVSILLPKDQWTQQELHTIQNIILGTHPDLFHEIMRNEAKDPLLIFLVKVMRTADYLGQMGQPNYIERLPLLYEEFKEACLVDKRVAQNPPYRSLDELLDKTPTFWNEVYHTILQKECSNLYQYLADPFPDGPNPYINTIKHHVEYLDKRNTPKDSE